MLNQLPELIKNKENSKALQLLASPCVFASLDTAEIETLTRLVDSKGLCDSELTLAILTLLIINEKAEAMLSHNQKKNYIEWLSNEFKGSVRKGVISALLLRMESFTNFKMVVQHIEPRLIPLQLLLKRAGQIREVCGGAFEKQIVKYKLQWAMLSRSEITAQPLLAVLEEINQSEKVTAGYVLAKTISLQTAYIIQRINHLSSTSLDLDGLCDSVQKIISVDPNLVREDGTKYSLQKQILIKSLKNSGLEILNALIKKLKRRFLRKYSWLLRVLDFVFTGTEEVDCMVQTLELVKNCTTVFGTAAVPLEDLLFSNASKKSVLELLTGLLRMKDVSVKVPEEHMQFRKEKKVGGKHYHKIEKVDLHLELEQEGFEPLINQIKNVTEKESLLQGCLQVALAYTSRPTTNYQNIVKLINLLDLHASSMSTSSHVLYTKIRSNIFPQTLIYSPAADLILEQLIQIQASNKASKPRKFVKTESISIVGTPRMIQPLVTSSVNGLGMGITQFLVQDNNNKLKRTDSREEIVQGSQEVNSSRNRNQSVQYQGWQSQKVEDKPLSEVFYSMKESRPISQIPVEFSQSQDPLLPDF